MTAGPVNRVLLESNFQNPGDVYSDLKTEGAFDVVADQVDDNWNYLAGLVNGGTLVPYPAFMSRQAIINGNFDVWQRGTTFINPIVGAVYTADRFFATGNADGGVFPTNIVHSRQQLTSGDVDNSSYFYRVTPDGAGSGFGTNASYGIFQRIENATRFLCGNGKKITVSFWARSNLFGKKLGFGLRQRYGTGGAPSASEDLVGTVVTLTTSWQRYTLTFTTNTLVGKTFGTNNDDYLQLGLFYMWGSTTGSSQLGSAIPETFVGAGNIDITQVQITTGDVVLPFMPRSFDDELRLCQRYYYKTFPYPTTPAQGAGGSGAVFYRVVLAGVNVNGVNLRYPVRMRTTSTVTFYNPVNANSNWYNFVAGADSGTSSIIFSGDGGTGVDNTQVVGDLVGHAVGIHLTADAEL